MDRIHFVMKQLNFTQVVPLDQDAEGTVHLTDVNTVTSHANDFLKHGLQMPGVIIVPDHLEIGQALRA